MVAIRTTSLIFTSVVLLASYVNAFGQIAQVVDANNFCVFLPPNDSVDRGIADTEWNAQAFCTGSAPLAKNAGKLPSGFITSAHYLATNKYVQVTGMINPVKARLNATDDGGQYDIKAPKGSSCAGWKYYVNLIEPAGNTYCVRCCNDPVTCNRGISEKGCAHIIPGDYSGPDSSSSSSDKTTTTTKKVAATTTAKTTTVNKTSTTTTVKPNTTTTTTVAPVTTTTTTVVADAAAVTTKAASSSTTTAATTAADANTTPIAAAADGASSSSSSANAASSSSSSSSKNVEALGQNESVTGQSVSGAEKFQPSMIAFTVVLVAMAMMNQ